MARKSFQFQIYLYLNLSINMLYLSGIDALSSSKNFKLFFDTNLATNSRMRVAYKMCANLTDELDYTYTFQETLYPGSEIYEDDYNKHLKTDLYTAWYSVGTEYTIPCVMEICGYARNQTTNSSHANCDQFNNTKLSSLPYKRGYIATSLRCGCNQWGINNCTKDTCQLQEAFYAWESSDCAIMYEEPNCQACYFTPIRIRDGSSFRTRNSHEIRSIIVKNGCSMERATHGYMEQDYYYVNVTNWTGIVTDISPSFHIRSANFTCRCPSDYHLPGYDDYGDSKLGLYLGLGIGIPVACIFVIVWVGTYIRNRNSNKRGGILTYQDNQIIAPYYNAQYAVPPQFVLPPSNIYYPSPENPNTTNSSGSNELKNEILRIEQKIETFLNTVFGPSTNPQLDQHDSPQESLLNVHESELCKISDKGRILSRTAFSINQQNPLGSGHFSTVYKGLFTADGVKEPVAVKKIKREGGRENWLFKSFLHEVKAFEVVDNGSVFIVKYCGACCHTDGLYLLTEFCERGSLRSFLLHTIRPKYEGKPMEIENLTSLGDNYFAEGEELETEIKKLDPTDYFQLLTWCENITSGMEYLHNKSIIHGDLAIRNVLLSDDLLAKICDFGLSRKCTNKEYYEASLIKGEFPFNSLAPECISDNGADLQKLPLSIDIWAFGCTLWEMFTLGNTLYADVEGEGMMKFIAVRERLLNGVPYSKPPLASDMIYDQMVACWSRIPDNRPSFETLRKQFGSYVSEFQI